MVSKKVEKLKLLFARVTHDILSPIHSIQGLSEIIVKEPDPDKRTEYGLTLLKMTRNLSQRVEKIIKEYYDPNRSTDQINLSKMTQSIIDQIRPPDEMSIEIIDNTEIPFFSHYNRLYSIIQNLIDNSVKYRSRNMGFVNIQFDDIERGIVVTVADDGIGIPEPLQQNIFHKGFRASQDNNGYGLGLYLIKNLVDELGGKIELESSSAGTIFYTRLPNIKLQ